MVMVNMDKILLEALALESSEKLQLIDALLASVYPVNKGVEKVWNDEVEERLITYNKGNLPSIDEETTFAKYKC
ncbi:MAG: Unknown protein [uncultured Sulfurovum sp.]|uniref:Addiction module protein n=1 Tax=uncultured Sulfurovum sp. TaxID=269237 RepID=A0A6S6TJ68_9BACT|nr:MAG: Unknown protein [uncultured Sulfurovum sp.]